MNDAIAQLLELQEADHMRGDLVSHIKGLDSQKEQLRQRAQQEKLAVDALEEDLEKLKHNSLMMNLEVDKLDDQVRDYQDKLDNGIISFKEMEALRAKITSQRTRIGELEDEALRLMDEIEERTALHAQEVEKLAARKADIAHDIEKIDERITQLREELGGWETKREQIIAAIPHHVVQQYEHLHAKFDDPVAPIDSGTCSGCKLTVSGTTVERARDGLEIVTCENCSRILYAR